MFAVAYVNVHQGTPEQGAFGRDLYRNCCSFDVWREGNSVDPGFRDSFEPNGLPDTGRAVVPDGVRVCVPILLTARLLYIGGIVVSADEQYMLFVDRGDKVRDVELERRLAAHV